MSKGSVPEGNKFPLCPGKPKVPSDGEVEALKALKSIKEQLRSARSRLKFSGAGPESADDRRTESVEAEIARLKREWDAWETRRKAAARERMILLGHEQGAPKK